MGLADAGRVHYPTGPCDTSSVGGTARGTSARDGLSALIGRTAPPVRLGRFHLVSDGARGCRTVRHPTGQTVRSASSLYALLVSPRFGLALPASKSNQVPARWKGSLRTTDAFTTDRTCRSVSPPQGLTPYINFAEKRALFLCSSAISDNSEGQLRSCPFRTTPTLNERRLHT